MCKILITSLEEKFEQLSQDLETEGIELLVADDLKKINMALQEDELDVIFLDTFFLKKIRPNSGIIFRKIKDLHGDALIILIGFDFINQTDLKVYDYVIKPIDEKILFLVALKAVEHKKLMDDKKRIEEENEKNKKQVQLLSKYNNNNTVQQKMNELIEHRSKIAYELSEARTKIRSAIGLLRAH